MGFNSAFKWLTAWFKTRPFKIQGENIFPYNVLLFPERALRFVDGFVALCHWSFGRGNK